jgi:hypothetical protein
MGWRELTTEKREELYLRKKEGEDIVTLANEVGANPETLSRHLRRFGQVLRGDASPKSEDVKVTIKEDGNTREIQTVGSRITTLDQLLVYCQVDPNEWVVERHEINKWEAARKATSKNLNFNEGKVDGFIEDSGGFTVEPLFQVKATLTRRKPEAITPVIQPVNINLKFGKPVQRKAGMKSALILPDPQIGFTRDLRTGRLTPFHDRLAMDVVRQIAEVIEPDVSTFLGDINDLSAWSDKFIRMPGFYFTTQPALIESSWYIGHIHNLTREETIAMVGNHDIRMETQITKHLVEAYQLRSADNLDAAPVMGMDNLLGLSRMGVKLVAEYPGGDVWLNETTRIIHGLKVRGGAGQTAAAVVKDANETTIFGHIHKFEAASRTIRTRDGSTRTITAYSPGCLCHIDGRVPGSNRDAQWQQGAAVVWYNDDFSHIAHINIQDGVGYYNGDIYVGHDYTSDLREETDWDF